MLVVTVLVVTVCYCVSLQLQSGPTIHCNFSTEQSAVGADCNISFNQSSFSLPLPGQKEWSGSFIHRVSKERCVASWSMFQGGGHLPMIHNESDSVIFKLNFFKLNFTKLFTLSRRNRIPEAKTGRKIIFGILGGESDEPCNTWSVFFSSH